MEFHYVVRFWSAVDDFDSISIKMLAYTHDTLWNVMIKHLNPIHYVCTYFSVCLHVLTESAAKHMFSYVQQTIINDNADALSGLYIQSKVYTNSQILSHMKLHKLMSNTHETLHILSFTYQHIITKLRAKKEKL